MKTLLPFLAAFDPDGSTMVFSIYLGGKRNDFGHAIALDGAGAAYITGRTESTNLPTASPLQAALASRPDAFVAKIVPESTLTVARAAGHVVVSWSGPLPGFALEGAENMSGPWATVPQPPVFKNGRSSVTIPAASACRFFRLKGE